MRYSRQSNAQAGFTLVEMLVAAPLFIIFIGVMIGLVTNLTRDAALAGARNELTYQAQSALETIEAQSRFEIDEIGLRDVTWRTDVASALNADQLKNVPGMTSTKATSNLTTLLIKTATTTMNPSDPNRQIVQICPLYTPSGAPAGTLPAYNFYYVKDGGLYRRVIIEALTRCGVGVTTWQRNSCPEGSVSTSCQSSDDRLTSEDTNVRKFQVSYGTGSTTISLQLSKQVGGEEILHDSTLVMPK